MIPLCHSCRNLMKNRQRPQPVILLLFCWLTSGSGCAVLNIPSYRADSCGPAECATSNFAGSAAASGNSGIPVDDNCPAGFLPPLPVWLHSGIPVPGWWVAWKAKKDLPEPAPFPRFQPLPTRPMFSPQGQDVTLQTFDGQGGEMWQTGSIPQTPAPGYGQLP